VVSTTVTFFSRLMLLRRFISISEFSSSRLDVGSSARIIFGLLDNALIMAIRCLSPPLRVSGNLFARLVRLKYSRSSDALLFLSCCSKYWNYCFQAYSIHFHFTVSTFTRPSLTASVVKNQVSKQKVLQH